MTALAGIHAHSEGLIEIRSFQNGQAAQRFFRTPDAAEAYARTLDGDADVYFSAATRLRESGSKADVQELPGLWADCDTAEAVAALEQFPLKPSLIVETSPGRAHAYWLFNEPLLIENDGTIAQVESVLKGIADRLNSDRSVAEVARIMRVPGSYNLKRHSRGRVLQEDGPRYELSDFVDLGIMRDSRATSVGDNGQGESWVAEALKGVAEGQRNQTTARLAGYLARKHPRDIALAVLESFGQRCRPPMDEAEIRRVFESIDKGVVREESRPEQVLRPVPADLILAAADRRVEWALHPIYPVHTIRLKSAAGKTSKTTSEIAMQLTGIYGGTFADAMRSAGGHTVAWFDAENATGSWARKFAAVCRGMRIDPRQPLEDGRFCYFNHRGLYLDDPATFEAVVRAVKDTGASEIVLDSLTRIHRQKENDAGAMSAFFIDRIMRLRDEAGAGITILHHHRKPVRGFIEDNSEALRGSSDLRNVVDVHVTLTRDRKDLDLFTLHNTAQRDAREADPISWRTTWTDDPLTVRFEAAEPPSRPDRSGEPAGRPPTARETALRVLGEALEADPKLTWTTARKLCEDVGVGKTTAQIVLRELRRDA